MATAVWTIFAVAVMLGVFAGCVILVVAAIRMLERAVGERDA